MEFNFKEMRNQLGDMLVDDIVDSLPNSDAKSIAESYLNVFAKHGISKIKGLQILMDLSKITSSGEQEPTKYVCNHCHAEFDKNEDLIEATLIYHLVTEHPEKLAGSEEGKYIENNFTEE